MNGGGRYRDDSPLRGVLVGAVSTAVLVLASAVLGAWASALVVGITPP